jgi:hypothetical protein
MEPPPLIARFTHGLSACLCVMAGASKVKSPLVVPTLPLIVTAVRAGRLRQVHSNVGWKSNTTGSPP